MTFEEECTVLQERAEKAETRVADLEAASRSVAAWVVDIGVCGPHCPVDCPVNPLRVLLGERVANSVSIDKGPEMTKAAMRAFFSGEDDHLTAAEFRKKHGLVAKTEPRTSDASVADDGRSLCVRCGRPMPHVAGIGGMHPECRSNDATCIMANCTCHAKPGYRTCAWHLEVYHPEGAVHGVCSQEATSDNSSNVVQARLLLRRAFDCPDAITMLAYIERANAKLGGTRLDKAPDEPDWKRRYEEEALEAKYAHHLLHGANGWLGNLQTRLRYSAARAIDAARIFAVHSDKCSTCANMGEDCGIRILQKAIAAHDESEALQTKLDADRQERGRISRREYAKKHGKEAHLHADYPLSALAGARIREQMASTRVTFGPSDARKTIDVIVIGVEVDRPKYDDALRALREACSANPQDSECRAESNSTIQGDSK